MRLISMHWRSSAEEGTGSEDTVGRLLPIGMHDVPCLTCVMRPGPSVSPLCGNSPYASDIEHMDYQ
jgi:hypothetical protein